MGSMMKRTFAVLVLFLMSVSARSEVACSAGVTTPIEGVGTNYVKKTFTPSCSVNVEVRYLQDPAAFAVQAASTKGVSVFGATTAGGAVVTCSTPSSGSPTAATPSAPDNPC